MATITSAITVNGQSTAAAGYGTSHPATVGVRVSGTWTGTLTFEGSVDGVGFVAVAAVPLAGGAAVTTTTANGQWRVDAAGLSAVRVTATAAITGTADVTLNS